jgi:hypothetical protein
MPNKFLVTRLLLAAVCWSATATAADPRPTAGNSTEQDAQAGGCGSQAGFIHEQLIQAGWWFRTLQGSPEKVAQYQDVDSSPFWSVESLRSDSVRTVDFFAAGLDQEANDLHLGLYFPGLAADIQYQRYINPIEPDWLLNFPQPVPEHAHPGSDPSNFGQYMAEDLNVGDDYAIRIQQLKAKFQGRVTDHTKWRLNVWSMRRSGHRQVMALVNSYDRPDVDGNCQACHVLSQRQQIDWRTVEIEPVVETRRGPITVSFSLPIRSFTQSDQPVSRLYNPPPENYGGAPIPPQLGSEAFPDGAEYPYALVPENFTQIRKLKIGVDLAPATQLYALLHHGSTDNLFRNTRRTFGGADLRLTDRTIPGVSWTGYAKYTHQDNPLPSELIGAELLEFDRFDESIEPCDIDISRSYGGCACAPIPINCVLGSDGIPDFFASDALSDPVDYRRTTVGWSARWRPFRHARDLRRGLSCYGRYEYRLLERGDAQFEGATAVGSFLVMDQSESHRHSIQLGASQRWATTLDSFLRYRTWYESDPLYGVRENNALTNSSLPTYAQVIEIGGTWSPWDALIASGTFGLENRLHDSRIADFDEWDTPMSFTLWYAMTPAWSFSAGYAYHTSRIHQAITLGDDFDDGAYHAPVTEVWGYRARSHVVSTGCLWRWTTRLHWRCDVHFVRGINGLDSTEFPPRFIWPGIAETIRNDRTSLRLSTGWDYLLHRKTTGYLRYTFLDYDDAVQTHRSGTAHMLLAGFSAKY